METVLYAYQMSPGKDDLLWFADTIEECQRAALEQRAEMRAELAEGEEIGAMAVYRITLAPLSADDLIRVLNEESRLVDVASVDRRLVALVAN